ncbi:hypothetical protein DsansV1_C24g0180951 [Dioscorea sansibarensis]
MSLILIFGAWRACSLGSLFCYWFLSCEVFAVVLFIDHLFRDEREGKTKKKREPGISSFHQGSKVLFICVLFQNY